MRKFLVLVMLQPAEVIIWEVILPPIYLSKMNASHDDILFAPPKTPEIVVTKVVMHKKANSFDIFENYEPTPFLLSQLGDHYPIGIYQLVLSFCLLFSTAEIAFGVLRVPKFHRFVLCLWFPRLFLQNMLPKHRSLPKPHPLNLLQGCHYPNLHQE